MGDRKHFVYNMFLVLLGTLTASCDPILCLVKCKPLQESSVKFATVKIKQRDWMNKSKERGKKKNILPPANLQTIQAYFGNGKLSAIRHPGVDPKMKGLVQLHDQMVTEQKKVHKYCSIPFMVCFYILINKQME